MRQIRCPHCQTKLDIGEYYRDVKLNIFCAKCKSIIFATNAEDEVKISSLYQKPTQNTHTGAGTGTVASHRYQGGDVY